MNPRFRLRPLAAALAVALLGALPAMAVAQDTGTITGQIVDGASQRPLAEAQISIPGTGIGTLSNSQGRYILLNVPPGDVTVRVDLLGYGTQQQTVAVLAGRSVSLDFALNQDAIQLEEIGGRCVTWPR